MLIQKKIEKGRLAIYIVIIITMIGGIIIFVSKNSFLGKSGGTIAMGVTAEIGTANSSNYNLDKLSENVSVTGQGTSQSANKDVVSPAVEADKNSSLIDLSLLSGLKFKMLKENILKSIKFETGKNNPFASY